MKEGWHIFDMDSEASLLLFIERKIKIPERANYEDMWERVIVPSIKLKYTNMRCSINNEVRHAYKSK